MKYQPYNTSHEPWQRSAYRFWIGPKGKRDLKRRAHRDFRHTAKHLIYRELNGECVSHQHVHSTPFLY